MCALRFILCSLFLVSRVVLNEPMLRIYAMNGKSVEVDNTDAEGRLVLAGASFLFFLLVSYYSLRSHIVPFTQTRSGTVPNPPSDLRVVAHTADVLQGDIAQPLTRLRGRDLPERRPAEGRREARAAEPADGP